MSKQIDVDANVGAINMGNQATESYSNSSDSSHLMFFLKNGVPFTQDNSGNKFPAAVEWAVFGVNQVSITHDVDNYLTWQLTQAYHSGVFSLSAYDPTGANVSDAAINLPDGIWLVTFMLALDAQMTVNTATQVVSNVVGASLGKVVGAVEYDPTTNLPYFLNISGIIKTETSLGSGHQLAVDVQFSAAYDINLNSAIPYGYLSLIRIG